jgi:hypothetical protein
MQKWHAVMALALATLPEARGIAQSPDHDRLRQLKVVEWPAMYLHQDVTALDALLAQEFQRVDGEGTWHSRAEELARVRASRPGYDSLVFEIRRLEVHGHTALVAGTGRVYRTEGGRTVRSEYQSTNVLVKRDGRWQAIASHTSGFRPSDA